MKISKTEIPPCSMLKANNRTYDYSDNFQAKFIDNNQEIEITEIVKLFFLSDPQWVNQLFALRNKLVRPFGLKTSGKITDRQQMLHNFKCEKGEQLGLFKVFEKTENEVILGVNDKHLNFRVSLFIDQSNENNADKNLTITTIVKFNHWFGRLYFLPVKPFHKLIVSTMLKRMMKNIQQQK